MAASALTSHDPWRLVSAGFDFLIFSIPFAVEVLAARITAVIKRGTDSRLQITHILPGHLASYLEN